MAAKVTMVRRTGLVVAALGAVALAACTPVTANARLSPTAVEPYSVAISVSNIDTISTWWQQTLGFTETTRNNAAGGGARTAVLMKGNFRLELVELDGSRTAAQWVPSLRNPAMVRGFGQFGFEVADVDAARARAAAAGARIVSEPRANLEGTKVMILADPDGNSIKIVSRISPGATS
jgi:catechol 2,3-dioxygenase-like lactoylglutathione lyase family enzyme